MREVEGKVFAALLLFGAAGCEDLRTCTLMYRMFSISVHDSSGEPVTDAEICVEIAGTGPVPGCSHDPLRGMYGDYCIVDESTPGLDRNGTEVLVSVGREGFATVSRTLVFRNDGCHPDLVDGDLAFTIRRAATGFEPAGP